MGVGGGAGITKVCYPRNGAKQLSAAVTEGGQGER